MIALKNFLHTLRRYKAATLLNILGLAVAFAAFYILMVQVRFDLNFRPEVTPSGVLTRSHYLSSMKRERDTRLSFPVRTGKRRSLHRPTSGRADARTPWEYPKPRCTIQNKARLADSTGIPFIKYRTACSKCSGSDA